MIKLLFAAALAAAVLTTSVLAQQGVTVQSLIGQGYEIKAVMPSNAGPGIVLQKDTDVVMCFVAEKQGSEDITTQYCKPVH